MIKLLTALSIRTRLLVVYVTIIVAGTGTFALIAGEQVTSGVQVNYEQRLQSQITLIAQGLGTIVQRSQHGDLDQAELDATLQEYERQVNGALTLYPADENAIYANVDGEVRDLVELKAALRGQVTLVQRPNAAGEATFYTAAPVIADQQAIGLIQLGVPTRSLQQAVTDSWLELALLFVVVTGIVVIAALLLAHSIIHPLYNLRKSAQHLAQGDFSHRIVYEGNDEMSAFASTFNEMAQQVESMLEEQRAFASNASHELRTPLTTIRQRTEALRYDETISATTSKRYIAQIDDEVIRLGTLLEELSLLSRFESGRLDLGHEQVDFLRLVATVQQQMATVAHEKNIQMTLLLPTVPVLIDARLDHLMVVFRNLLDNAIKYTPNGGSVIWEVQQGDQRIINKITDTGIGIDTSHLPHVFERFYRADKAHSRTIPGTGLGLALVKSIVAAYGGQVTIESAGMNRGTIVYVVWPCAPNVARSFR